MAPLVCQVGMASGAVVFFAGLAWAGWGDARMVYSPEQAQEYVAAANAGHVHDSEDAVGKAAAPAGQTREARVAEAKARFDRAKQTLETARFLEDRLGGWAMAAGVAMTAAFGVGYWSTRS